MEIKKVVNMSLGAVIGAGFLVIIAKHGDELGKFMTGTANALVGFGKGIGQIG